MKTKEEVTEQSTKSLLKIFKKAYEQYRVSELKWVGVDNRLPKFEKGEMVQVTDKDHKLTNFWFEREFIEQDSDGMFICRQIEGTLCRWDYIRKL